MNKNVINEIIEIEKSKSEDAEQYNFDEDKIIEYLSSSPFNYSGKYFEYDIQYNACVGDFGGGEEAIYDGYVDAVASIVKDISKNQGNVDVEVYPLLFCVRHSIELFLKNVLCYLQFINIVKNNYKLYNKWNKLSKVEWLLRKKLQVECNDDFHKAQIERHLKNIERKLNDKKNRIFNEPIKPNFTHDIKKLTEEVTNLAKADKRFAKPLQDIQSVLDFYLDIDKYGDAFRYLNDKNNRSHFEMKEIRHVRLDMVYVQFVYLIICFKRMLIVTENIYREYRVGTFTKKLSRKDIKQISLEIPEYKKFSTEMKNKKSDILKKYDISSNEFSQAVNIIERNREFSYNIGKVRKYHNLRKETLKILIDCIVGRANWVDQANGIAYPELCLLRTFYEIGYRNRIDVYPVYSEDLGWIYLDVKYHGVNPYDLQVKVPQHLKYITDGMEICGQFEYLDCLKTYLKKSYNISLDMFIAKK